MSEKANLQLMARYNQWMNQNIYDLAEPIDRIELARDRGAYFGSILGTLNHLLVTDIIWLKRFAAHRPFPALDDLNGWDKPDRLDLILHDELQTLKTDRTQLDMMLIGFCQGLSAQELEEPMRYKNMAGISSKRKLGQLLLHLFNHQTHHRGQASTLFSQLDIDLGVTDFLQIIPEI